jgi:hypothetical protein
VASAALFAYLVLVTRASLIFKGVELGLFGYSFACFYWMPTRALVGLLVLVGMDIFIVWYRTRQHSAHSGE